MATNDLAHLGPALFLQNLSKLFLNKMAACILTSTDTTGRPFRLPTIPTMAVRKPGRGWHFSRYRVAAFRSAALYEVTDARARTRSPTASPLLLPEPSNAPPDMACDPALTLLELKQSPGVPQSSKQPVAKRTTGAGASGVHLFPRDLTTLDATLLLERMHLERTADIYLTPLQCTALPPLIHVANPTCRCRRHRASAE